MIFVDSGYFIALLTPRDQLHQRALNWSRTLAERLLTTEYVLCETVNWFSAPVDRAKIHDAIDTLKADADWHIVAATSQLFASGLTLHRQHADKHWSLTDCISFLTMREQALTRALTHDHHFEQAGFESLLRRDPT
jgi:predicted nucleic acid-binding protein